MSTREIFHGIDDRPPPRALTQSDLEQIAARWNAEIDIVNASGSEGQVLTEDGEFENWTSEPKAKSAKDLGGIRGYEMLEWFG